MAALFQDPEQPGRGRFLNCPSGWTCEGVNRRKLQAYGLDALYVDFRPGTGAALDASIVASYLQGRNILFYYFSPSAIAGKLALVKLREPPFNPACWRSLTSGNGPPVCGCGAPPADVAYGVSTAFARRAPQLADLLAKATVPLPLLNENLVAMADAQRQAPAQALLFLHAQPALWHSWVPADIAARIDASLQPRAEAAAARVQAANAVFPPRWVGSLRAPVNRALAALVRDHGAGFRAAAAALLAVVVRVDWFFHALPWWVLIGAAAALAWASTRRVAFAAGIAAMLFCIGLLGLWDLMLQTLTLMLIASFMAIMVGLPCGVLVAKSPLARTLMLPTLDIMQTMPGFVYLIPALMLFGLGKVPAILATIIYALPPMIRLTALGIDQVDAEIKEAAEAFGATRWQMLLLVELPLALPSLMAGVNQTIMLALSMVVVASMIGASGLGEQVLNGIQTLDIGEGLEAGIGIVLLAIVLDRLSQAAGRAAGRRGTPAGGEHG
jgi:glycine betaine/proline transport system substrate-binding protein